MEEDDEEEEGGFMGDEDDELFSLIDEETIRQEIRLHHQVQPSTSHQMGGSPAQSGCLGKLPDFDEAAGMTWIFPVNYPLREYQYSMAESALFQNTLISLPTGLGKTFIAAVVMYNFYRWYPTCKVVFMAPTKPLVAQQVEACFNIMGIPQRHISQMTGTLCPEKRTQQWREKRVFFLTPQVVNNDLASGTCPATQIRCLVLDEAHRALGNHAYCQVVSRLRAHGHYFRILALSATPGSDLKAVKQVLGNLLISHVDIRNEDSPDIQQYTYERRIEKVVVPFGDELTQMKDRYLKVLRYYVNQLKELNVVHTRDETTLSKFQILKSRECFRQDPPAGFPRSKVSMVERLFALSITLYHSYDLMLQHGTRSFYRFMKDTLNGEKSNFFARTELVKNKLLQTIMDELTEKFDSDPGGASHSSEQDCSSLFSMVGSQAPKKSPQKPFVISHPKMAKLLEIVLEHHQRFASEGKSTRVMIFSQYRDSVIEITEMLQRHHPVVKAMRFIGHSRTTGNSGKGLSQKKQLQVIREFRQGGYNTLVSTCVGEEGLDIGDVDLIICYDAPKSPVRLVQRMGRTGRQRKGRIVVLVTKGKEEQSYNASQYQKKTINDTLANTSRLTSFLCPSSPRMVPLGLSPLCLKLHMKVDEWQAGTRGHKTSPGGQGSGLSTMRAGSSNSENSMQSPLMTPEAWQWYRQNKVPQREVKTLPPPSLMCLNESKPQFDPERHIDLGSVQPWQSLPQPTHVVGHAPLALHLVELTEFIHLQQHIDPDEDPYGLEMAAFLDRSYIEESQELSQLSPEFKRVQDRHHSAAAWEGDGKEKKRKRKQQTATAPNKRKPKSIQSSLITDLFNRMTQSQKKSKENKDEEIDKLEDIASEELLESKQSCGEAKDDDDDVICLDDAVDISKNTIETVDESPTRPVHSPMVPDSSKHNSLHQREKKMRDKQYSSDTLYFPIPKGSSSPVVILSPPRLSDDNGDEIMEPHSPSEVLEFCSNWVMRNLNIITESMHKPNANVSKDIFESTTKSVSGSVNTSKNKPSTDKLLEDADDSDQLDTSVSLFSVGDVSPVIGKAPCPKTKTSTSDEYSLTSKDAGKFSVIDTSPIVGRGSPLHQASTPKVVSKCLFKKSTPGLLAIEEFSPITKTTTGRASSSCYPPVRGNEHQNDTKTSDSHSGHRNRFRSKLSRFMKPEAPEEESGVELSPIDKARPNCSALNVKEGGKVQQQNLHADTGEGEENHHSDKPEIKNCKLGKEFYGAEDIESLNKTETTSNEKINERTSASTGNKKCIELEDNISPEIMEDFSLFESLVEVEVLPDKSSAAETQGNASEGVNVTQVHRFMQDTFINTQFNTSNPPSVSPKIPSQIVPKNGPAKCVQETYSDAQNTASTTSVSPTFPKITASTTSVSQTSLVRPQNIPRSKVSLSLRRNSHESDINVSVKADDMSLSRKTSHKPASDKVLKHVEPARASTFSPACDSSRLSLSRPLPKQSTPSTEWKKMPQGSTKEKCVSFLIQEEEEKREEELSESLLDDIDFNLIEIPHNVAAQDCKDSSLCPLPSKDETGINKMHVGKKDQSILSKIQDDTKENSNVSILLSMLQGNKYNREQSNRDQEISKDQDIICLSPGQTHNNTREISRNSPSSNKMQDKSRESTKLLSPTQDETQLFIPRKRKACNVVGSDLEDSLLSSDSEKDVTKASTTLGSSMTSLRRECVAAPSRENVARQRIQFDVDDDDDFVEVLGPPQPKQQQLPQPPPKPKNVKKNRKRKRLAYLDDEAELSRDGVLISSDESEVEEDYDCSFVDDGTYLSQDNALDMKAVYLRSVVSPPVKKGRAHHLGLPPPPTYIHDSDSGEEEEGEDSFVVDNSFVEYETEYIGETMLAEDPIINQALHAQGNSKKTKDAVKRKRIILNDSSSEDGSPLKPHSFNAAEKTHNPAPASTSSREQRFLPKIKPLGTVSEASTSGHRSVTSKGESATNSLTSQGLGRNVGEPSQEINSGTSKDSTGDLEVLEISLNTERKGNTTKVLHAGLDVSLSSATPDSPSTSALPDLPQLNTSTDSFFVAPSPAKTSLSESQTTVNSSPQEAAGVLVDSKEVVSAGNILSRLRLHHGVHTAVVHLPHAHYAVSTRMAVARLSLAAFSSPQQKSRLLERVRAMLQLYEHPVLIVEDSAAKGSPSLSQQQATARSRYLDTIVCACIQVPAIKVLYSQDQGDTAYLLWQLTSQEKTKGFKIPVVPPMNKKRQQMANFYRSLPGISYPVAVVLAQNFTTVKEFVNSSAETILQKGSISLQRARAVKRHITKQFSHDV